MHGRADCLRVLLIEGKCNVNTTRPSDSWTPLHTAAACGEEQCVQCLLDHGAKVNAVDTSIEKFVLHTIYVHCTYTLPVFAICDVVFVLFLYT